MIYDPPDPHSNADFGSCQEQIRLSASVTFPNRENLLVWGRSEVSSQDKGSAPEKEKIRLHSSASIGNTTHWKQNQVFFQNSEWALDCMCASKILRIKKQNRILRIAVPSDTFQLLNSYLASGACMTPGQLLIRFGSGNIDLISPD